MSHNDNHDLTQTPNAKLPHSSPIYPGSPAFSFNRLRPVTHIDAVAYSSSPVPSGTSDTLQPIPSASLSYAGHRVTFASPVVIGAASLPASPQFSHGYAAQNPYQLPLPPGAPSGALPVSVLDMNAPLSANTTSPAITHSHSSSVAPWGSHTVAGPFAQMPGGSYFATPGSTHSAFTSYAAQGMAQTAPHVSVAQYPMSNTTHPGPISPPVTPSGMSNLSSSATSVSVPLVSGKIVGTDPAKSVVFLQSQDNQIHAVPNVPPTVLGQSQMALQNAAKAPGFQAHGVMRTDGSLSVGITPNPAQHVAKPVPQQQSQVVAR